MKNLLIRLISFVICVGLFIAGLSLTIAETMSNEAFLKDFEEIGNAKWLPEVEKTEEEPDEEPGDETGGETGGETGNDASENE